MNFSLTPPNNVTNLFGGLVERNRKKVLIQIWGGVCDVLWAMCNVHHDFIFNKQRTPTFIQIVPMAIQIRVWSYL
jgi:uncharacterized protein (DUF779 family)